MDNQLKIISIIGTRPQYIKVKPIFDSAKKKSNIEHIIVDTFQHYSPNISDVFIKELKLNIYKKLQINNRAELNFISECILEVDELIKSYKPDGVIVYGDTNSTFCAALTSHKNGIPVFHVEAGVRGFSDIPEEINRVYIDRVSDLHFCTDKEHLKNVEHGIFSGDLEYELLNSINPDISYKDFAIMTIHRQNNVNMERLNEISRICKNIKTSIKFFAHPRTEKFILNNNIKLASNIELLKPISYTEMIKNLSQCKFVLTDSGSIQKTLPFFGKKGLILRQESLEWKKVSEYGYSKKYIDDKDLLFLSDYRIKRNKEMFLLHKAPSKLILDEIENFIINRRR